MATKPHPLQTSIDFAASQLSEAFEGFKATKKAKKTLEKQLEQKLEENVDYLNLIEEEKTLKKQKREILDTLKDIKHQKELMARDLDEHEELEQFVEKTEGRYLAKKDEVLQQLSMQFQEEGITAETNFKGGDLMIVVARKK